MQLSRRRNRASWSANYRTTRTLITERHGEFLIAWEEPTEKGDFDYVDPPVLRLPGDPLGHGVGGYGYVVAATWPQRAGPPIRFRPGHLAGRSSYHRFGLSGSLRAPCGPWRIHFNFEAFEFAEKAFRLASEIDWYKKGPADLRAGPFASGPCGGLDRSQPELTSFRHECPIAYTLRYR
jgi:hypothetical protein